MIVAAPSAYHSGMRALGKSLTHSRGGDLRRCYTTPHQFYGGLDLQARSRYVCVLSHDGELVLHRHMQAAPEAFLKAVAPAREGLVVAVECLCTGSWLAALWAEQGIPFVLGHALDMKAIHGGKAQHDTSDSPKMAALLRGGMLPKAYGYPAQMRATRDLLRRRTHLMRTRAELWAHVHHTTSPYHLPEIGKNSASQANRAGVAERFSNPAVHKPLEVDLALITHDDALRKDRERDILNTAQHPDANTLYLVHTVPGLGQLLRLVWLYEIYQIDRFPRGQDFAAYARLVKCSKESGGKRLGTSGKNIGNAPLKGAFSEAATLCLRSHPQGQKLLSRLEKKHDQGNALRLLAHQLGRAVYDMRTRHTAFDLALFLRSSGSSAGEPGASRDSSREAPASSTPDVQLGCVVARPGVHRTRRPAPWRLSRHPLWLRHLRRMRTQGARVLPLVSLFRRESM
jgi:transposase